MTTRTDRNSNSIGSGTIHATHHVIDLTNYPQVSCNIDKSNTSETVYVKYFNSDNNKEITARFSWHDNNAVLFGEQLNGATASSDEILYHLGLRKRTFVPDTYLAFAKTMVKKVEMVNYQESNLTIQEIYTLGAGADLSDHTGKLAKGSNWLIQGTMITEKDKTRTNPFGQEVRIGNYIYA